MVEISKHPHAFVRAYLSYNARTGVFRYRRTWKSVRKGKRADRLQKQNNKGYFARTICVKKKRWVAARIAWLYMTGKWPEFEIDHIDCNGANNKWDNLREATRLQNCANTRLRSDNKSGFKGVSWDKSRNRWTVSIYIKGKRYALGRYRKKEDAISVRAVVNVSLYGEFARHV